MGAVIVKKIVSKPAGARKRETRRSGMASPTSGTLENPEVPRAKGGTYSKGTPAAMDDIDAAHSDERSSQGQWLSEAYRPGC